MKGNILILGGDKRQLYAAENFIKNGYYTEIYGFSQAEDNSLYRKAGSLSEAINKADTVILPMPVSRDNITLNAPLNDFIINMEDIFSLLSGDKKVYGGMISEKFYQKGISATDYAEFEELVLKNAALTAEGVLSIIISSTPFCILNTKILITGYGRIGKILADYVKALGGIPVVCARKETDFAWCDIKGIEHICYKDLKDYVHDFKIIVNTVPTKVITEDITEKISLDCFVIDLASKGGGVDFCSLEKRNIRYIYALGIPGKFSSEAAGKIISEMILKKEKRTEDIWITSESDIV